MFRSILRPWLICALAAIGATIALLSAFMAMPAPAIAASPVLPAPAVDNPMAAGAPQTAVLAGGCFWGVQGVFEHVRGVRRVLAGYSGGAKATAQYEIVSTGMTGHAESVQITFDPAQISYGEILRIFFSVAHDPTELNRQGPDVGIQYRSSVFYGDDAQKKIAEAYVAQLGKTRLYRNPIVTRVDPLKGFYPAESFHQDYLIKHPDNPYIWYNDLPKIRDLQSAFPKEYQGQPVRADSSAL